MFPAVQWWLCFAPSIANPPSDRAYRSIHSSHAFLILGSSFVLKFIVLAALSDPAGGWLKRALLATLAGVTLGTLTQEPFAPVTGYASFFALALFLGGLALLPRRYDGDEQALVAARQLSGGTK